MGVIEKRIVGWGEKGSQQETLHNINKKYRG